MSRLLSPAVAGAFDAMWADLQPIGRAPSGGYRRYAWSAEDHQLREWFAAECECRGLEVTEDRAGNQWAWWGDPDAAAAAGHPGVALGSHLDSVPDGGAFDGPLGVVSALCAVDALREAGVQPARPLAVVSFGDEEGARFGVACTGSRVLTGAMSAEHALGLSDIDGIGMAEALRTTGRDPGRLGPDPEAVRRVGCFVELHVEQGRALADLDRPVAVASDIWPHGRWRIEVPGEANHAGTTRLEDRRDALLGMAQVVLATREEASRLACLATIGKVSVEPGGVNAIASRASGWLDCRGPQEGSVRELVARVQDAVVDLGGTLERESWTAPTAFDEALSRRLRAVVDSDDTSASLSVPVLGTGAGHDAGILAQAGIPAAMLFVRNPTGVSHSPVEHAELQDCYAGVAALTACAAELVVQP